MMFSKLLQFWQKAASDLGLQITAPFSLILGSGNSLEVILLVHQFGAAKGMLVFTSYDAVAPYINEIVDAGYGFSVLDDPKEDEDYDKEDFIELLADWGWSGETEAQPDWL